MSCGIGMLGLNGVDGRKLTETLRTKYNIYTAWSAHEEYTGGMRVTASVYTTVGEVDHFCDVMETELKSA
jgi:selenocysteine lyase/cysteine desulfurase